MSNTTARPGTKLSQLAQAIPIHTAASQCSVGALRYTKSVIPVAVTLPRKTSSHANDIIGGRKAEGRGRDIITHHSAYGAVAGLIVAHVDAMMVRIPPICGTVFDASGPCGAHAR